MKTTTLILKHSILRGPCPLPLLLATLALACFALSPQARATCQDACLTNNNTVQGDDALLNLTTGTDNTALGFNALLSDTTGGANTAVGSQALANNTHGTSNTATGDSALLSNTRGSSNTATGNNALSSNTFGDENTATGSYALKGNTIGDQNTATGTYALSSNTVGTWNTANGSGALGDNVDGSNNVAVGTFALVNNESGGDNTAVGLQALVSNTTSSNNIGIGFRAGSSMTGSNNIFIGNEGKAGDSKHIRIGTSGTHKLVHIAGINGSVVAGGVGVIIDLNGKLGTVVSSERFKDAIKPMDKASEAILSLKPVTFRYKQDLDPDGIAQFGLVAEQVEKVNPELVACDDDGKPYSVRYEAVNAMLLNEFLKEHLTVQEQGATIARLEKQIEALTAGLQKVSAQLEASKPAAQVVNNP